MPAMYTLCAALLAPLAIGAVLYLVVGLWSLWRALDREDDEDDGPKWGHDR